jgi:hypothetical protein
MTITVVVLDLETHSTQQAGLIAFAQELPQ